MSGNSPWERQKQEINSYNTFYSAITGRASEDSFHDRGYILVNFFPTIQDPYQNTTAQPDFLLYNGESLLLAEIKSGSNIEERHVNQVERFSQLSIESVEEYLKQTGPISESPFRGDVNTIEPFISYQGIDREYIDKCRNQWPDCGEKLSQLEAQAPILIQSQGDRLEIVAGSFQSDAIQDWLNRGIELPDNPKKELLLTEGMEPECLSVAICGIWGQRAAKEDVEISITEVRSRFDQRAIEPGRVRKVFHFLDEIGACDMVQNGTVRARFTQDHLEEILNIEQRVSKQGVDEWLK